MILKTKNRPRISFHLLTVFPAILERYWEFGVIGRAVRRGSINVKTYNLRDFAAPGRRGRVDDRPYGGGPGMVLEAGPIIRAGEKIKRAVKKSGRCGVIILSPRGKQFNNLLADRWLRRYRHLILICGRYEGIDARVKKMIPGAIEVSIGPYILSGGELPALVIADVLTRRLPGTLHDPESVEEKRPTGASSGNVYTRPEIITHRGWKYRVPKVLLSGHHAKITAWRGRPYP